MDARAENFRGVRMQRVLLLHRRVSLGPMADQGHCSDTGWTSDRWGAYG